MADELLNRKQAAEYLKISTRTLGRLDDLPRVQITKGRVVYRRSDLATFVELKAVARCAA